MHTRQVVPRGRVEITGPDNHEVHLVMPDGRESVLRLVLDFVALVRRNWLVVIGSVALALIIAALIIRIDTPIYRATATVRYDDQARALSGGLAGGSGTTIGGLGTDPLLTQIQVLQSRAVATEVVELEGLRLTVEPASLADNWLTDARVPTGTDSEQITVTFAANGFTATTRHARVSGAYGVPVKIAGISFIITRNPGIETVRLSVISLDQAVSTVVNGLRGRPRERTDIIDVSFEAGNPWLAQRVANSASRAFAELNARSGNKEAVRRRQFIEGQLSKAAASLSEAQAAHSRFRSREKVFSSMERFRAQQTDFLGIELRRQELSADRGMYASLLGALVDTLRPTSTAERLNALISSPGIAANAVVAGLFEQLTRLQSARDSLISGPYGVSKSSPDMIRTDALIASTEANIIAAVRGQISAVDARLSALDELKERSSLAMASLPTMEAAEADLLAQVETYRREADRLREALQKAQIDEAAQVGQITIVDLAPLPTVPIGTGKKPRILFALFLGIALGTIAAYVIENHSAVVRRREDVERVSTLPILAVVPPFLRVTAKGSRLLTWMQPSRSGTPLTANLGQPNELVTVADVRSSAAEAFRTLRTNLLFSDVASMRHIVVTSAGLGDGKSTVAANLAIAFAQQGKRVLLIDCDLRRARLHKVFRRDQIPGLTNALVKGSSYVDSVVPTDIDNLMLMPAGSTPPNPVELLGSQRMHDLIEHLSENFELLVFDTPPVLVASDATILSRHTDTTLFVVRAGKTQSGAFRDGLEQLARVGTRIIGTLINDPGGDFAKFASYYGYYYGDPALADADA
jgi:capsular exopolysaccharide synthesis family protein